MSELYGSDSEGEEAWEEVVPENKSLHVDPLNRVWNADKEKEEEVEEEEEEEEEAEEDREEGEELLPSTSKPIEITLQKADESSQKKKDAEKLLCEV